MQNYISQRASGSGSLSLGGDSGVAPSPGAGKVGELGRFIDVFPDLTAGPWRLLAGPGIREPPELTAGDSVGGPGVESPR